MIQAFEGGLKIHLCLEPVDMRKSIDGLSVLVVNALNKSPQSGELFLFCNRQRNKLKGLVWDRNGFFMVYKRLEKGRFKLKAREGVVEMDEQQLNWLLYGLEFIAVDSKKYDAFF